MTPRVLLPLLFTALLAACSSPPETKPVQPTTAATAPDPVADAPLPANMREVSGVLRNSQGLVPAGAQVEIALLAVNAKGLPQRLLASETVIGKGAPLAFRLPFNPGLFPTRPDLKVEFHARLIQAGQLASYLPPVNVGGPTNQNLGELVLNQTP